MNPYDNPIDFDTIVLGTRRSPGVVTLSGHDRADDWDVQAAKGQDGASSSLNGKPLGEFQASFHLVIDYENGVDEIEEWESFQRLIDSTTNGPTPIALPIYHPDLARNGFTEVVKRSVSGLIHDGQGGAIVQVKFGEHRPPKPKPPAKAKAKSAGSTPGAGVGGAPPKPDPNAAHKRELAALLEEAKRPI